MPDIELQFRGNMLAKILLTFPCPQRVLMVTDGFLGFGTDGFGLAEFVTIVQAGGHSVTTAHRGGDPAATITDPFDFFTAVPAVSTANYDQIWLFGHSTTALSAAEQATLVQFMQAGGGIFATGDHSTIGAGMGTSLPRVRALRNWSSIPMVSPDRLDTVLDPGADSVKQFEDQSDAIPQRIYPVFFSNGGPDSVASSWSVHPVLRHASGAVDFLPDHPHESECLAPTPVAGSFAGVEEWPAPLAGGARIPAQVVAVSISAGRFITSGAPTASGTKPPVKPRCFGAISAYDGDAANVGRIVCDATWHHFVNINLNGSGAGLDPTTGLPRSGLYAGGAATPEYLKIQGYYLNTVRWLAPRNRRRCWPFLQAALARFDFEMLEVALPQPHPCPWDPLIHIGQVAEAVLTKHWGPGALAEVVDAMLVGNDATPTLTQVLRAQQSSSASERLRAKPSLLPLLDMRRAVLGSVVNLIAHKLPGDPAELARTLKGGAETLASDLIAEGIRGAEQTIYDYLQGALRNTGSLVRAMQSGK